MVTSPSEIAEKRRVLALLEKMKAGEALAPGEIREVKAYEASRGGAKSGADRPKLSGKVPVSLSVKQKERQKERARTNKKSKKAGRTSKPRTRRPPISQADVKRLAFTYDSIAQADQQAGTTEPLIDLLAAYPGLMAAWGRGELLRRLQACASVLDNVHDVARELGFAKGGDVRAWFDGDREAQDLWRQTRMTTRKRAMGAMVKAAIDGNQRAIQIVAAKMEEDLEEKNAGRRDWNIVTLNQIVELTGRSRQTVYSWRDKHGMPSMGVNKATRVDLRKFWPWFEEYSRRLITKGVKVTPSPPPLTQRKIRREDLQYKRDIGDLLERGHVIAWQISVIKIVLNAFVRIPDLVNLMFNQSREVMVRILEDFQGDMVQKLEKIPDVLQLEPPAEAKLVELYEALNEESDGLQT